MLYITEMKSLGMFLVPLCTAKGNIRPTKTIEIKQKGTRKKREK